MTFNDYNNHDGPLHKNNSTNRNSSLNSNNKNNDTNNAINGFLTPTNEKENQKRKRNDNEDENNFHRNLENNFKFRSYKRHRKFVAITLNKSTKQEDQGRLEKHILCGANVKFRPIQNVKEGMSDMDKSNQIDFFPPVLSNILLPDLSDDEDGHHDIDCIPAISLQKRPMMLNGESLKSNNTPESFVTLSLSVVTPMSFCNVFKETQEDEQQLQGQSNSKKTIV